MERWKRRGRLWWTNACLIWWVFWEFVDLTMGIVGSVFGGFIAGLGDLR